VRHPGDRGWLVGRNWRCVREQQYADPERWDGWVCRSGPATDAGERSSRSTRRGSSPSTVACHGDGTTCAVAGDNEQHCPPRTTHRGPPTTTHRAMASGESRGRRDPPLPIIIHPPTREACNRPGPLAIGPRRGPRAARSPPTDCHLWGNRKQMLNARPPPCGSATSLMVGSCLSVAPRCAAEIRDPPSPATSWATPSPFRRNSRQLMPDDRQPVGELRNCEIHPCWTLGRGRRINLPSLPVGTHCKRPSSTPPKSMNRGREGPN